MLKWNDRVGYFIVWIKFILLGINKIGITKLLEYSWGLYLTTTTINYRDDDDDDLR